MLSVMPRRGGQAHVATIKTKGKGGKVYTSYLLRRSYREGGKVRHENLGNLSHLPLEVIDAIRKMLAGRVLEFPIGADGRLGPRSVWARLQDLAPPTPHADAYNGPDGLKLGSDGNYYIAQNGSSRVLVVSGDKTLVRTLEVPTPYVTNIAFGTEGAVFVTGAFEQWKPPYPGAVYRWAP